MEASRREWAENIVTLRRDQIDYAMAKAKEKMEEGDEKFEWPNIPLTIGLANGTYKPSACYQHGVIAQADRQRAEEKMLTLPDTPERITKRQAAGRSALNDMRDMLK